MWLAWGAKRYLQGKGKDFLTNKTFFILNKTHRYFVIFILRKVLRFGTLIAQLKILEKYGVL